MRAAAASRPIPLSLCRPGLLRSGGADRLDGVRRVFFLEPFPSYLAALVTPHGLHLPYTHRSTGAAGAGGVACGRPDYGHLELSFSGVFTLIIYGPERRKTQTKNTPFPLFCQALCRDNFAADDDGARPCQGRRRPRTRDARCAKMSSCHPRSREGGCMLHQLWCFLEGPRHLTGVLTRPPCSTRCARTALRNTPPHMPPRARHPSFTCRWRPALH